MGDPRTSIVWGFFSHMSSRGEKGLVSTPPVFHNFQLVPGWFSSSHGCLELRQTVSVLVFRGFSIGAEQHQGCGLWQLSQLLGEPSTEWKRRHEGSHV
uniref:Uncharacterized protein n=1 Tax=Rhinopithecus roxellana TaxID=61622 RepID=A0A2K6Q3I5_RHIRO